jgi:hypothetical protein
MTDFGGAVSIVNDVLVDIEEDLGARAYLVYQGDERHLIDPAVTAAIALALLKDYLSGFLDLKALGKAHRDYLVALVQRIREGALPTAEDMDEEPAIELAKAAQKSYEDQECQQAALEHLIAALIVFGLDEGSARETAQSIAKSAKPLIK